MSEKISALKAQAQNLRAALEKAGTTTTLAFAQELLAQQYGLADWNTLVALADKKAPAKVPTPPVAKPPRLSDVPAIPDEVRVEIGTRTKYYSVEEFDEEFMLAIDDPVALAGIFEQYPHLMNSETETTVIMGYGDGDNLELTVADLKSAVGQVLGGTAYWTLADGRIISFVHGRSWVPEAPEEPPVPEPTDTLVVPALLARSSRGCKVACVKEGLAVLPANMSQARFQELLTERLSSPLEANDVTVDAVCAQLGVQWLSRDVLESAGVKLLSSGSSPKEPTVIPETYVPSQHSRWALNPVQKEGRWTVSLTVPVRSEKVHGPTADYEAAVREVSLRATGTESGLVNVIFYPADSRTLPPLSTAGLKWVRVMATLAS